MALMEYCTKIKHTCTISTMHEPIIRIVLARTAIRPQKHNNIVERQQGIRNKCKKCPMHNTDCTCTLHSPGGVRVTRQVGRCRQIHVHRYNLQHHQVIQLQRQLATVCNSTTRSQLGNYWLFTHSGKIQVLCVNLAWQLHMTSWRRTFTLDIDVNR